MKTNVGSLDSVIRVVLGVMIFSLVFIGPKTLWGLLGLGMIVTGLVGYCPPYHLLGINTCRIKKT